MCGALAAISLLPTFHHASDDRPLPRPVRAVRAEDGACGDNVDGPLESWHMFARRQDVSGGSAVVLALQEDVVQLAYPPLHSSSRVGSLASSTKAHDGGPTAAQILR